MQRKISFIVAALLIVFVSTTKAQQTNSIMGNKYPKIDLSCKLELQKTFSGLSPDTHFFSMDQPASQKISFAEKAPAPGIRGDFYVQHLGFMCKTEYKLEKATHIPFRFRLGSLQYCNYLEGKK